MRCPCFICSLVVPVVTLSPSHRERAACIVQSALLGEVWKQSHNLGKDGREPVLKEMLTSATIHRSGVLPFTERRGGSLELLQLGTTSQNARYLTDEFSVALFAIDRLDEALCLEWGWLRNVHTNSSSLTRWRGHRCRSRRRGWSDPCGCGCTA